MQPIDHTVHQIIQAVTSHTVLDRTKAGNTHTDRHFEQSDKQIMERLFDQITACSRFQDAKSADYFIETGILIQARPIAKWLTTAEDYEKQHFNLTFLEDEHGPVGTGLVVDTSTNTIKEYQTDAMRLVLQKNPRKQLGFSVLTAYPDMDVQDIKPTGRSLSEAVKSTDHYQRADATERAYMLYRTHPKADMLVTYKKGDTPQDSVVTIHVPTENPNMRHMIRVKENAMTLSTSIDTLQPDGQVKRDKVPSKYTKLRDELYGNPSGVMPDGRKTAPVVNLKNPVIRKAFQEDFPQAANTATILFRTIKHELNGKGGPTSPPHNQREADPPEKPKARPLPTNANLAYQQPRSDTGYGFG